MPKEKTPEQREINNQKATIKTLDQGYGITDRAPITPAVGQLGATLKVDKPKSAYHTTPPRP